MKKRFLKLLFFFFCISDTCLAGYFQRLVISPEGTPYLNVYTRQGSLNIMKYNSQRKALDVYFPIANQEKCHINYSALDSMGKKLAYFGYCRLTNSISSETSAQGFYYINVMNIVNKKEIITFNHGGNLFSFSPKGDSIVFAEEIPGEPGFPAPPGYQGGVWLYNFNTKTKKMILPASVVVKDLNWSEHDNNIYFLTYPSILRYNAAKAKIEEVPYKGIYFSSDGKYYAETSMGGSHIYRTADNVRMMDWNKMILEISEHKPDSMSFQFWSNKLKAGIFSISGEKNVVFDVEQGKVIGVFTGYVIGTNPDGTLVAVHPSGKDGRSKIEILNLLDLVNKSGSPK